MMTMATTCCMLLALTLSASLLPGAHPLSETDALIAFKKSLTDPQSVLSTWNASQPNPCSWQHVTCNSQNQVTGLFLIHFELSGELVPELGSLPALEQLIMDQNDLSGTLPAELGNLKAFHTMIFSNNVLSGFIPPSFGNLQSLTTLGLDHNLFEGRVPAQIVSIKTLKIAAFNDNKRMCWEFQPTPVFRGDYPVCSKKQ